MNRKGQSILLSIVIAVMIFMVGSMMVEFFKPDITLLRVDLQCSSASTISDGTKLACLLTDVVIVYWIMAFLSFAGGVLTERFLT